MLDDNMMGKRSGLKLTTGRCGYFKNEVCQMRVSLGPLGFSVQLVGLAGFSMCGETVCRTLTD